MTLHTAPHPLAGQTVKLQLMAGAPNLEDEAVFRVEDWWDRVSGGSWMVAEGNPAALSYAVRAAVGLLDTDDEVVYGKDEATGLGHIVHVCELVEPEQADSEQVQR